MIGPRTPDGALVALDVDGTLMTYDGVISAQVRELVADLRDAGTHLVLATGRGVRATTPVLADLGLTEGWAVCSNGAVTVRVDTAEPDGYEVVRRITFDPAPALRVLQMELPDALFAVEDLGRGFLVTRPFPDGELIGEQTVCTFEDLISTPVTRVVVRDPGSTPEAFRDLVHRVGLHRVTYAVGWVAWLDLTPGGITKGSALEDLRQDLGVEPFATVAVGDGANDIDMLKWAARGVAMGHAQDDVRTAADEVTGTIEDDGLAEVLRSVLEVR